MRKGSKLSDEHRAKLRAAAARRKERTQSDDPDTVLAGLLQQRTRERQRIAEAEASIARLTAEIAAASAHLAP